MTVLTNYAEKKPRVSFTVPSEPEEQQPAESEVLNEIQQLSKEIVDLEDSLPNVQDDIQEAIHKV